MDKDVYGITVADESAPGKYALMITRSMSPFEGAKHAVFYVDGVRGRSYDGDDVATFEGYTGTVATEDYSPVVTFPAGSMFIVVPRDRVSSQTSIEFAKAEQAKEKELAAAMEEPKEVKPDLPTGQYA
jgi:hypothetical protein